MPETVADTHEAESERWAADCRPSYDPDWGDGQIHLDGEKDFPADMPGDKVVEVLRDRTELVGGFVQHHPEKGEFSVSSQMGALSYVCKYPEAGEPVTAIRFKTESGREYRYTVLRIAARVTQALLEDLTWGK